MHRSWKPIRSAPRDGRRILLFGTTKAGQRCAVAEYQQHNDWGEIWCISSTDGRCGVEHFIDIENPTHWQPLPDPPGAK